MMRPPSLQKEYSLVFSGDDALALPADEKEREEALRIARETGNWAAITKAGAEPTVFHVMPLTGTDFAWLNGQRKRNRLSEPELAELTLRLALRKIDNFGPYTVSFADLDGHQVAKREVIDALYLANESDPSIGRLMVAELGGYIFMRAAVGLSPKS